MTELEQSIADELRITPEAANILLPEIQKNIKRARAELIRSGISDVIANSSNVLIEDAIVMFCLARMGEESEREKNQDAFTYQEDCLRKSTLTIEEAADEE